jgi:NhaP-type Na+/H+ or K+/H+ antiporter
MSVTKILQFVFTGLVVNLATAYEAEDEDTLLYMFLALFIGAGVTYIISRYAKDLPYTVTVFFLGVILAVGFHEVGETNLLKISIAQWEGFNGELIIYIFLPALTFGDSMSLNFHHVKENLFSAFLLATVQAAFATALGAVFVKFLLPYDWDWSLSLLFGAIICGSDPVGKTTLLLNSFY